MDKTIDEKLIRASQKGDRSAFERLLDLIYDLIYRFAFKWAGSVSDAEDITQQACIKLAKSIRQFRFESAFTTWLYRLVVNCAKDWARSQHRHSGESIDEHNYRTENSQAGAGETLSELDRVLSLVDQMGEGFRETLLLVYAEGLNHREAAEVLGVKESTVSWRLHEIKKRLKRNEASTVEEVPR